MTAYHPLPQAPRGQPRGGGSRHPPGAHEEDFAARRGSARGGDEHWLRRCGFAPHEISRDLAFASASHIAMAMGGGHLGLVPRGAKVSEFARSSALGHCVARETIAERLSHLKSWNSCSSKSSVEQPASEALASCQFCVRTPPWHGPPPPHTPWAQCHSRGLLRSAGRQKKGPHRPSALRTRALGLGATGLLVHTSGAWRHLGAGQARPGVAARRRCGPGPSSIEGPCSASVVLLLLLAAGRRRSSTAAPACQTAPQLAAVAAARVVAQP